MLLIELALRANQFSVSARRILRLLKDDGLYTETSPHWKMLKRFQSMTPRWTLPETKLQLISRPCRILRKSASISMTTATTQTRKHHFLRPNSFGTTLLPPKLLLSRPKSRIPTSSEPISRPTLLSRPPIVLLVLNRLLL